MPGLCNRRGQIAIWAMPKYTQFFLGWGFSYCWQYNLYIIWGGFSELLSSVAALDKCFPLSRGIVSRLLASPRVFPEGLSRSLWCLLSPQPNPPPHPPTCQHHAWLFTRASLPLSHHKSYHGTSHRENVQRFHIIHHITVHLISNLSHGQIIWYQIACLRTTGSPKNVP